MRSMLRLAVGALVVTAATSPAWAERDTARYTSLTIFGDSLVDAGNIYAFSGGATPAASDGYFQGRFTNGPDYTDLLSQSLFGLGSYTKASLTGGSNYAFGGARVVDTSDGIPDLDLQLSAYKLNLLGGGSVDENGLYILNFGGNDIFQARQGNIGTYTSVNDYLSAAATQYAAGVQTLNDLGARNILITGFPVATDPYSLQAEGLLITALANLTLDSDTTLFRFSYLDFFGKVLLDPASLGLPQLDANPANNCVALGQQANGCAGLFYFDSVHPTAQVQQALYNNLNAQFDLSGTQPVPEPEAWALLVAGFGLIGGAMRRARRVDVRFA